MPLFNYIAIDKEGKQKEGTLEVGSQNEAIARIKEMGFYPTQVAEVKDAGGDDAIKKAAAKKAKRRAHSILHSRQSAARNLPSSPGSSPCSLMPACR